MDLWGIERWRKQEEGILERVGGDENCGQVENSRQDLVLMLDPDPILK